MIYTDNFVWLHFPKCAGTTIEKIFKKYAHLITGIHLDPTGIDADKIVAWHDTVSQRENRDSNFSLGERVVICAFRRLPSWLASRYAFEVGRSPNLPHSRELLLKGQFLEQSGETNHADTYARSYIPPEILNRGRIRFIRTEHFKDDFYSAFHDLTDISFITPADLKNKANEGKAQILSETLAFLERERETLYVNCPYWKSIETHVYGQ